MSTIPQSRGLFIGGEWVPTPQTSAVIDPFRGEAVAHAPLGDRTHLELALGCARAAFQSTRRQEPHERVAILRRVVGELERRRPEFIERIVAEAGKPVTLAEAEFSRALLTFTLAAEEARRPAGEVLPLDGVPGGHGHSGFTRRLPIGVVYGMTPFNFPLNLVAHKVAPALATGNTLVVKPAPKTPLTALLLAEALQAAQVPAGQVNVVTCRNEEAGHLVGDPRVAMTSFTGSPSIGWGLKERCGRQRILLELGGNAPVLVHEDADLAAAVPAICHGAFAYAGQSCISVQRVLVHRPVLASFRGLLLEHVRHHVVTGDPRDPRTLVGPMIDDASLRRVLGWIQAAVDGGASVLGGGKASGPCLLPTLLEGVQPTMEVCAREVFAPLLTLQAYDTFEQGLAMANDTPFGLQAGVFTRDIGRAHQAFSEIEAGAILINNVPTFRVEGMPYGGTKQSGFGREGVRYAMEEMTEIRSLILKLN